MNPPVVTYGPGLYPVLEDFNQQPDAPDRLFELVGRGSLEGRSRPATEPLALKPTPSTPSSPGSVKPDTTCDSSLEHSLASDVVFLAAHLGEPSSWEELRQFVGRLRSDRYLLCSILVGPHEELLGRRELSGAVGSIRDRSDFVLPVNTSRLIGNRNDERPTDRTAPLVAKILRKLQNRLEKSSSRVEGLQQLLQMNRQEKIRFLRVCTNGLI